jgi:1-acyl-sn-glycerol-3-phosphate acyltransferase
MLRQSCYWLSRPILGLYGRLLRLDVHRHATLPKGAKIITANHPSTSDPFLIALITREPARMLIIHHAFDVPLLGAYLRKSGHIPVYPDNGRPAFDAAEQHLRQGGTLIVFPEGQLSPAEGGVCAPHTGTARLALLTGVPVIPMGISLSPQGLWTIGNNIGGQWVEGRYALRGPYGVTVGQPLRFGGEVEDRAYVRRASRRIMQHITELAMESRERLAAPLLWPSALEPIAPV